MSELVSDCPRCGAASITFDLTAEQWFRVDYGWQRWYEAFCICRKCRRGTVFVLSQKADTNRDIVPEVGLVKLKDAVNRHMNVEGHISLKDKIAVDTPDHVPKEIANAFQEGATSMGVNCWNAAGTMFRLCVDLATRSKLPDGEVEGLSAKTRRDLGLRLPWLFENNLLPRELQPLSACIKEDGNDAAHAGTLTKADAEDLLDFTTALLERMFTEPERLRLAQERREKRRQP